MNDRIIGQVKRVNGPVIEVMGITDAEMFELVRVGDENLIGELIKLEKDQAVVQVYEDTTGIAPHDPVYGAGRQLSVELGPGITVVAPTRSRKCSRVIQLRFVTTSSSSMAI